MVYLPIAGVIPINVFYQPVFCCCLKAIEAPKSHNDPLMGPGFFDILRESFPPVDIAFGCLPLLLVTGSSGGTALELRGTLELTRRSISFGAPPRGDLCIRRPRGSTVPMGWSFRKASNSVFLVWIYDG